MQPITDKIIDKVKAWQARPLETIYPFVWLDAIHYKIKDGGKYVSKAVYTVLGVNMEGRKEILGLYLSESEGANFWLSVLTDLNITSPINNLNYSIILYGKNRCKKIITQRVV